MPAGARRRTAGDPGSKDGAFPHGVAVCFLAGMAPSSPKPTNKNQKMKKIMLLAAVLLAATVARAQDDYNPNRAHEGWYYGVTVGLNVANMAKEEGGDALVRTNGGVFGGYRVGRFLAVQAELLYSGSGTSMYIDDIEGQKINDVVHLNMTYLNLPVTAKIYLVKGLNVHVGVQPGFLVRKRLNYRGDKYEVGDKEDCNTYDFCVPLGIGYDFGHLTFDVRYQQGTVDVIKGDDEKTLNTLLCFNFGYKF